MSEAELRQIFKIIIAGAAILMLYCWRLVLLDVLSGKKRLFFDLTLIVLAAVSVFAYFEFGWLRYNHYMNPHDGFHYYIGAKYSPEHQYFDLYRTALIADKEMNGVYTQTRIRNLDTHRYENVTTILRNQGQYKQSFSPARWGEFKKDILYFQSIMPAYKWTRVLRDKGYNATPVWNAIARALFERSPTDNIWSMRLLTYIDLVCLIVMFGTVWAAFGWRVMLFAIIFHTTNYFMAFVHIKGGIMRLDWVTMLVVGLCFVKMKHYALAGGVMAYASMARIFPFIFCFGIGVKLLLNCLGYIRDRVRSRRQQQSDSDTAPVPLNWNYVTFFASFAVFSTILVAFSAFSDGGFGLWENFRQKILVHNADISTTRAGFKYIFLFGQANYAQYFSAHQTLWWCFMALALLLSAVLMRKAQDYETIALGFIPAFFLTAPTFYYYVMLLVPLFLFLPRAKMLSRVTGAALTFLLSGASFTIYFWVPHGFLHFLILSCCMLALIVYMAGCVLFTPHVAEAVPTTTPPLATLGKRSGLIAGAIAVAMVVYGLVVFGVLDRTGSEVSLKQDKEVELVFVGDVMLSRNVARSIQRNNRDFSYPFQATSEIIRAADVAFCNLESPISGRGTKVKKNYTFNAPAEAIDGLVYAGFDIVSMANNHVLDYGPVALEDTVNHLAANNIKQVGLSTSDAPQETVIFVVRGVRIGYLAYCDPQSRYGTAREFADFDRRPARGAPKVIERDLALLKPRVDIAIVSLHWGVEYKPEPNTGQIDLAHAVITMGADIVAGHHPHVQQKSELYNGGLILYSMGNFVFDQHSRPATRISEIYRVVVGVNGLIRADSLPVEIPNNNWQPYITGKATNILPSVAQAQ